jgi:sec-independent protein translocase protein TatA
MGFLSPTDLIFVLAIALIVFGPKRLPAIGKRLGRSIREFRGSIDSLNEEPVKKEKQPEIKPPTV